MGWTDNVYFCFYFCHVVIVSILFVSHQEFNQLQHCKPINKPLWYWDNSGGLHSENILITVVQFVTSVTWSCGFLEFWYLFRSHQAPDKLDFVADLPSLENEMNGGFLVMVYLFSKMSFFNLLWRTQLEETVFPLLYQLVLAYSSLYISGKHNCLLEI